MKKQKQKMKKIFIILIISTLLIATSTFLYASSTINNPTYITFEDSNLVSAVRTYFNAKKIKHNVITNTDTTYTVEVSIDDINTITELDLSGNENSKITNLSGLQAFENVTQLNLSGNQIQSLSPIVNELELNKLNLSGNTLNDNIKTEISTFQNLTELNLSNTGISSVEFLRPLNNITNLTLSSNGFTTLAPIASLINIEKLDIAQCGSFSSFAELTALTKLKELEISGTGIYYLNGIESLRNLEKLYAANIDRFTETSAFESIYATYKVQIDGKTEYVPYLSNLKVLNLSNLGIVNNKPSISLKKIAILKSLEELHLKSNEISSISGVAELENLDYLDLADNEIDSKDLGDLLQYDTDENGNKYVMTENTLRASKIDLSKNNIIEIGVFSSYPGNIKWLNLSENHIYKISPLNRHKSSLEILNLQKQNITFGIYEKMVEVDHLIILPEILKRSKIEGSLVYSENSRLTYEGVTLNPDYTNPEEYNVIIDSVKTKDDKLSVTLTGGNASGTVLNFTIGSKTNAHVDCLIESIVFVDKNLDASIYNYLRTHYEMDKIKYLERVPFIININQAIIKDVDQFNLANTSTNQDTKIRDLTGIENFLNLEHLQLQNNDLINIDPLIGCTKLQTLYLANNYNIGNNNSAIEYLSKLVDLDLTNTGMTNINSINNMIYNNYTAKRKTPILAILKISGNRINNIDGLEAITSLVTLGMQNIGLNDQKIAKLNSLTNLVTLNISENEIENIDVVSYFTKLQYFYFNANKVKSLEPINGMVFSELKFSDNKIKDISPLSTHQSIHKLEMNNNQIEDVSILTNILITDGNELSLTGQRLTRVLEKGSTGNVAIQLPQIFKAANEIGNKVYTSYDLVFTNCDLDSTGENIIINADELGDKIAQVSIYGGKANGTTLSIASPLEGTITYTPSNETPTNQNVTARITFNRTGVTIANNNGNDTYTFTENGEFTFEFSDKYGFEERETAIVTNIDKIAPEYEETRKIENKSIVVTIKAKEPICKVEGWTISTDKKIITKTYSDDANETIRLIDIAGNSTEVRINVTIDKIAPKISGVQNNKTYKGSVTPVIQDENLDKITLTKDGLIVPNYKAGTKISDAGKDVLTATDKFGNSTTVSFEIQVSDKITSGKLTIEEENLIVNDIVPKTTVTDLKKQIVAEMNYEIIDKNGNVISNSSYVGTGSKIKMANDKIYTLIVPGDCNGDGKVTVNGDIIKVNSHRLSGNGLTGVYLRAADLDENAQIKIRDIILINSIRLNQDT